MKRGAYYNALVGDGVHPRIAERRVGVVCEALKSPEKTATSFSGVHVVETAQRFRARSWGKLASFGHRLKRAFERRFRP